MRRIISPVLVCLCAVASSAAAQSREAGSVILEGSAFVGIERAAHVQREAPVRTSNDLSATVFGGSLAAGTFLSRNVSVRLEVARPGGSRVSDSSPVLLGDSLLSTVTSSSDYQSWATTVLAGYHTEQKGRLRLAYLAGVAFVREQTHLVTVIASAGLPPIIPARTSRTETTAFSTRPAIAVGMDAEIAAARHLAVVPQLRVVGFAGSVGVRPGVALRWKS